MKFDDAFTRLLGHEGGYVNHRDDPGGETNWGISTAPAATTVNTAADWDLTVTLQAANSTNGDTITLDAMTVVLF